MLIAQSMPVGKFAARWVVGSFLCCLLLLLLADVADRSDAVALFVVVFFYVHWIEWVIASGCCAVKTPVEKSHF